jgi:hypothetical protein
VLPDPVAFTKTEAPSTGLPNPSLAVTVIVALLDPLLAVMIAGAASIVDCVPETAAATTVTVPV